MGEIDWSKLYQATSKANQPTPGYLFNDIVRDVSNAKPSEIPAVAEYLADCVDGDHAHVKLKALFVIKSLAYRVPPFCSCMQDRLPSVQDASSFTGPPSALFGDEPYRLVREAADGALLALTGGQYYHEQYREMSQRIVGFGNYLPDDDTVLPDGTINVGRDVTYKDLTLSTVGLIGSGVGAILGGVKDILVGPFTQRGGSGTGLGGELGGLGGTCGVDEGDDMVADEGGGQEDFDQTHDLQDDDQDLDCGMDEDGCYHPSAGSYVPPTLPGPTTVAWEEDDEDLFQPDLLGAATSSTSPAGLPCLLGEAQEEDRGAEEEDEAQEALRLVQEQCKNIDPNFEADEALSHIEPALNMDTPATLNQHAQDLLAKTRVTQLENLISKCLQSKSKSKATRIKTYTAQFMEETGLDLSQNLCHELVEHLQASSYTLPARTAPAIQDGEGGAQAAAEGALFRLLGVPTAAETTTSRAAPAAATAATEATASLPWPFRDEAGEDPAGLSEAEILDILGVAGPASPSPEPAAAAPTAASAAAAVECPVSVPAAAAAAAGSAAEAASLASLFLPPASDDPLADGKAPAATSPTAPPPSVMPPAPLSPAAATAAASPAGALSGGPGCAGPGMLEV